MENGYKRADSKYNMIAICGRRRAGKDTIADILCKDYGYKKIRIADTLKRVVGILFDFSEDQMECDKKDQVDPRWGISPRQALQFVGTDVMQHHVQTLLPGMGRSFWIRSVVENEIKRAVLSGEKVVIPDLRFLHEEKELRNLQFKVWKVVRENHRNMYDHNTDGHASEQEWLEIREDLMIENDGDVAALVSKIHGHLNANRLA